MKHLNFYEDIVTMVVTCVLILTCCAPKESSYEVEKKFLLFLRDQGYSLESDGRQVFFVITLEGCDGCIDACLDFVSNRYRNERLKIVLTQSSGRKSMKLRAGEQLFSDNSVIKDFDNDLARYEVVKFEPVVFFFEDSQPKKHIYLNMSNLANTFEEIRSYLTSAI
jgi:hypothetical protein